MCTEYVYGVLDAGCGGLEDDVFAVVRSGRYGGGWRKILCGEEGASGASGMGACRFCLRALGPPPSPPFCFYFTATPYHLPLRFLL